MFIRGSKISRYGLIPVIVLVLLSIPHTLTAQRQLRKIPGKAEDILSVDRQYLKMIYQFPVDMLDTLIQEGPDPLLIPRYKDSSLIPVIFDAVFNDRVQVYNPNFWGTIPQFLESEGYEPFDTSGILRYLSAGWDTSLVIDHEGNLEEEPVYRKIPYQEISGIFFFESWWMDEREYRLYKDIYAYLPIREYLAGIYEGFDNTELRKRLLFMVIPEYSGVEREKTGYRRKDFVLAFDSLEYTVELYNKSYNLYLNREKEYGQIGRQEYYEWQYHQFDFYRYFDPDLLLEKMITGVIDGKLRARVPGEEDHFLSGEEFIGLLQSNPFNNEKGSASEQLSPRDYPLNELNSLVFLEDWYINPDNLQIYKDVRSVTVNRTESRFDTYTGDFIQSRTVPLFTISFD